MSTEREAARGIRAKALLDDELMREAFQALEEAYTDEWKRTADAEGAKRDRLWIRLKLLHEVKAHLLIVAEDGKIAAREIEKRGLLRR